MFSVSSVLSVEGSFYLALAVFLPGVYLVVSRFWWGEAGSKPYVRYKTGSRVCEAIVQACSTLNERWVMWV